MSYTWEHSLEIGDKLIDGQHKELVEMYNKLYAISTSETIKVAYKNLEIKKALDFLCTYTVKHFTDEEELMRRVNFPEFTEHKQQHEEFKLRAVAFTQKFAEVGFSDMFANLLNAQIGLWLVSHIQEEDSKISECLK